MQKVKNNIWLALVLVINLFVFIKIFSPGPLVGGDAPFYSPELMREFFNEPPVWTHIGLNFGSVNQRIFIYPLMIIFSAPHNILGINQELLVRVFFYMPAIFLSIISSYVFAKKFKLDKPSSALTSLFYSINTYFLLLIDGGQAGIALAYGFFPLTLLALLDLNKIPQISNFYKAVFILSITSIVDPRFTVLAVATWITMAIFKVLGLTLTKNLLISISFLVLTLLGVNMYWIYLTLKFGSSGLESSTNLNFTSVLNGLAFFQPHWPENTFGNINQPPWYFLGLLLIILLGLFNNTTKRKISLFVVFLIMVFFLKGTNYPLGNLYEYLLKLPFGYSFRDSSKFFVPVMLLGGVLLSMGTSELASKLKNYKNVVFAGVFLYLVILIYPVYTGKMNYVLSDKIYSTKVKNIIDTINLDNDKFKRTVWIPERHPQELGSSNSQALEGKSLSDLRPLADLTAGSSDKFNYVFQDDSFVDWYRILGIDYIVTSGDTRNPNPNSEESDNWAKLIYKFDNYPETRKIDSDLYKIDNSLENIYFVNHAYAVVGPFLQEVDPNEVYFYFEDGKLDPELLNVLDPNALKIVFNEKDNTDLLMSLLKSYFVNLSETSKNDWSYFSENDYLLGKYQLLIRDLVYREFTYGVGFSMSDRLGEEIELKLTADKSDDYVLAIRAIGDLELILDGSINNFSSVNTYNWYTNTVKLNKGDHDLIIRNKDGLGVVNTAALIPMGEYNKANQTMITLLDKFGSAQAGEYKADQQLYLTNPQPVAVLEKSNYYYNIQNPGRSGFIVFTDTYTARWVLKSGGSDIFPLPAYSEFNAYYVNDDSVDMRLEFDGQSEFRKGVIISVATLMAIAVYYLYKRHKDT